MAVTKRAPAPEPVNLVSFMDLGTYVAPTSFGLTEGITWACTFDWRLWRPTDKNGVAKAGFEESLVVMVTGTNVDAPDDEPREAVYSCGKIKDFFLPNPDDGGKSLIAIPGKAGTLNPHTNWAALLGSLYSCGLAPGQVDDFTGLDGIVIKVKRVQPPGDRSNMKPRITGEGATEQQNKPPEPIAVVSEIIAAPWEGQQYDYTKKKIMGVTAAAAPAAKKTAAPVKAAKVVEPELEEEATEEASGAVEFFQGHASTVLGKNEAGMKKLKFRMDMFSAMKKDNEALASEVNTQIFANDAAISAALADLGFMVKGADILPVA